MAMGIGKEKVRLALGEWKQRDAIWTTVGSFHGSATELAAISDFTHLPMRVV
jgi:hypothetical protein